ncbi:nucleotidyltransferase domain-containing protein [Natranaeroarchaeum aerophilus]|uniref:Nucleotidyltransferase domain-containing protein n=1 Tax=Natranaeroarchaeum aerophilus TaxID=2917711 RepID=A0AAE3K579_9EURY|nr:nucleotidyltransferase domain-containing protein [Natranaeroarchaeum aerophilus]MCL9813761.1 nucleotidyltransferase domain-containing protein [Natranaeroarchaeum aerophilus]
MNRKTVRSGDGCEGTYVCLPIPLGDREAFRHRATADILHILADNPDRAFSNRELHRLTDRGMSSVNAAVLSLEALGIIRVDRDGRSNAVQIHPERFVRSDDPVTTIPQTEFHDPVRTVRDRLVERIGEQAAIVLFGSVARGEADRASDIDVFVIVGDGRMAAQRAAHSIEDEITSEQFDGDRFEPHIVVETRESAVTHDRIRTVLVEGITLQDAPVLDAVKQEVFANGT